MEDTLQAPHTHSSSRKSRNVRTFSSALYLANLMGELDRAAICQRIGGARKQAGLSQPEMGEAMNPPVHMRTVQTWESVKAPRVPWDRLDEIAKITGVTKEWLLHGPVEPAEDQLEVAERLAAVELLLAELVSEVRSQMERADEAGA